jgi:hypothetical protein
MSKKKTGINPELEKHINKLLEQVMIDETASITEKMKVVDRALKLEQLKAKISDDEYGSGFFDHDDGEDDKDI